VTSTHAVRRFRDRKRSGTLLIRIEVDGLTRDELVDSGLLPAWDAEDPAAVAAAVERLLRLLPVK
jgi:hypothetical protein